MGGAACGRNMWYRYVRVGARCACEGLWDGCAPPAWWVLHEAGRGGGIARRCVVCGVRRERRPARAGMLVPGPPPRETSDEVSEPGFSSECLY